MYALVNNVSMYMYSKWYVFVKEIEWETIRIGGVFYTSR